MGRLAQGLLDRFPRRRRRQWRYVSPRRRGAGVFVLAMLLTATYAYWALTNDGRMRREAQRYLKTLTGLRVKIGQAQFRLFGPVRLRNVRVYMEGSLSGHPFFQAQTVMLRHNPWHLLTRGTIQPHEIICIEPVVTFEQDETGQDKGREKLMSMVSQSQRRSAQAGRGPLPAIRLRHGKWQAVRVGPPGQPRGRRSTAAVADMPVSLSMIPRGTDHYVIQFEERQDGDKVQTQGKLVLDLATGKWSVRGYAPSLPRLRALLPAKYRKWLKKYAIDAGFHIRGEAGTPGGKDTVFEVTLEDLSMTLPPAEGGVKLVGVSGKIVFREDRVQLKGVTGRPVVQETPSGQPEAPQTQLRLWGEYLGYQATSDFAVNLEVDNLRFPSNLNARGELGKAIGWLQRQYAPHGCVNLSIRYERKGGRPVTYRGSVQPLGIAGTYRWFPYPLTHVTGTIEFTAKQAKLVNVVGRHGAARFTINGIVQMRGRGYDITVRAEPGQFDQQLCQALPKQFQEVWRTVSPGGLAAATVHAAQKPTDDLPRIELEMTMDGQATMAYRHFPYPLEGIVGHVRLAGQTLQINRLVGHRGPMRCTVVGGRITGLGTKRPGVDMVIEATDVPLDETLEAAVGPDARRALASLHAAGRAERVSAKLRQEPGGTLQQDIRAWLRGVRFRPEAFPYEVTDASGLLIVTPERTVVKELRGRHGEATVTVRDSVFLVKKKLALDLRVEGSNVPLDPALYAAIPPKAQQIWRSFSPAGAADLALHFVHDMPGGPGKMDYRLDVRAKGVAVRYQEFPYPFQGVIGTVVVRPDLVEFENLRTASGAMEAQVGGSVRTTPDGSWVELKVKASSVPVDDKLLKALPEELALVVKRLKTGGACDLDFQRLAFLNRRESGAAPGESPRPAGEAAGAGGAPEAAPPDAAPPESRPTTAPAGPTWHAAGEIRLHDVNADLGYGYKKLTGTLRGRVGMKPQGLELQAAIALDSVALGSKKLTDLKGSLAKGTQSPVIRITDLLGKVHGGRMSGLARIRGPEPFQYALNIWVEDVNLAELLNAGVKDPKKRTDVQGALTGDIKLRGRTGLPASNEGEGRLRITKAKLYKLPVLLGALHVVMLVLPLPQETAFHDVHVNYRIRGQQLIFQEIHLTGPALSIIGSGRMNLQTEKLHLTFLTGRPGKLPRMASLPVKLLGLADELLKVFLNELAQVEVRGTLKAPITRTVPLRSLNTAIRRLTNPEELPE